MKRVFFFLLLLLAFRPESALSGEWQLDPVHTNFYFEARHTYAAVRGRFTDFSGDVYFDPDHPEQGRFNFVIKADSVDTGVGKRDTHLRSHDFFDAGEYPLITFRSKKVSRAGNGRYIAEGTLTIKDVSRDLALEFVFHGEKENPLKQGEIIAGLDAHLVIDRLEYHVGDGKFYKMGVVEKDVAILVTLELVQAE